MTRQKRIMILGGNYVQALATKVAKELGYYVISTDLHEDNPGHKIADEYCKIDIIDKDAVLREAQRLEIDGITPFCSDVLAPIAAYVQDKMNLPGNPYDTVDILTHKHRLREFMHNNGFLAPRCIQIKTLEEAIKAYKKLTCDRTPSLMLKPTDSAGSKGVFKIDNIDDVKKHWEESLDNSPSRTLILEDFIDKSGKQQGGDIFVFDGKIIFWGIGDQYMCKDEAFVPMSLVYPSTHTKTSLQKGKKTVQAILTQLGFKQGPCNVEYIVDKNENIWLLEIGPRNGGNMIPLMLEKATGVKLTEMTIKTAVGDNIDIPEQKLLSYAMYTSERINGKSTNFKIITNDKPLTPSWI